MARPKPDNSARDHQIAARHRLGETFESLATEFHLTRQRIAQIVKAQDPRPPGEAERAEVAATLRRKYDELQAIIDSPPLKVSAMSKPTLDPRTGEYVIDASVVVRAVAEQVKIFDRYRQLFGVDIGQPPGRGFDERHIIMEAEIRALQQFRSQHAALPPLPPHPDGYHLLSLAEQARADLALRRTQKKAQDHAITAAQHTVIPGEVIQ